MSKGTAWTPGAGPDGRWGGREEESGRRVGRVRKACGTLSQEDEIKSLGSQGPGKPHARREPELWVPVTVKEMLNIPPAPGRRSLVRDTQTASPKEG